MQTRRRASLHLFHMSAVQAHISYRAAEYFWSLSNVKQSYSLNPWNRIGYMTHLPCPPPWGRGTAKRWWGNSTVSYCKSIIAILLSFIVVHRRSMTLTIFSLPLCLLCNHGFLEGIVIRSAAFLCCPSASSPLCFSFHPYICASRKILTNFFEKK